MRKLSRKESERQLTGLDGWRVEDDCLKKDFKFADFAAAWDFMEKVAGEAERLNHHPDWSNSYKQVSICLTSHSAGGLTDKDFSLAAAIDKIAAD